MRLSVADPALGAAAPAAAGRGRDDVDWIAAQWGGPVVVEGVLTPEDAIEAVRRGGRPPFSSPTAAGSRSMASAPTLPAHRDRRGGRRAGGGAARRRHQERVDVGRGADARGARGPGRPRVRDRPDGRRGSGRARVLRVLDGDLDRALGFLGCAGSATSGRGTWPYRPPGLEKSRVALTCYSLLLQLSSSHIRACRGAAGSNGHGRSWGAARCPGMPRSGRRRFRRFRSLDRFKRRQAMKPIPWAVALLAVMVAPVSACSSGGSSSSSSSSRSRVVV